jgi:hypothetical protein
MAKDQMYTKSGQTGALLIGFLCLWMGANAVWNSYHVGYFTFTFKRATATGNLAIFEICSCLVVGTYLFGTAIRHLEDC